METSNAMAVCELSSLDEWTMLELLDRVPLDDLLHLGQVNWRLKQLVERNCRQSVRRQLTLIIGLGDDFFTNDDCQLNSITVTRFDRQVVERLLHLLPGTTSLWITINSNSNDVTDELLYLLEGWFDQLQELFVYLSKRIQFDPLPLFSLFNRMSQLKRLGFWYFEYLPEADWIALHLPVISQLEEFSITTFNDAEPVMRQLLTHATASLTRVGMGSYFDYQESCALLLDAQPHLANCFSRLRLCMWELNYHLLASICQQYQSVCHLTIHLNMLTIGQVNRALAMLPELKDLCITVHFPQRREWRQAEVALMILGDPVEPDTADSSQLVPLARVTTLTLQLTLGRHSDFEKLHLGAQFPNLVNLNFNFMACRTCGYDYPEENMATKFSCLKKLQWGVTFGEMLPKLTNVKSDNHKVPEEYWQPAPQLPRQVVYFVATFFIIIIGRQIRHQLNAAVPGKGILKATCLLAMKAFKWLKLA